MLNDAELACIARNDEWALTRKEIIDMAKELLAYRNAFGEPEAWLWVNDSDSGKDVSLLDPEQDDDAQDAEENGWVAHPLYRKPEL